ncbi:MAG TPA: hypothetical protein VME42_15905 [Steroidobacteraceae bacterium]|nr:hypothetical protein [Steroidobacteraceae bacterium]
MSCPCDENGRARLLASLAALAALLGEPALLAAGEPASRFGVDAPELAHLGPYAVGVRSLELIQPAQPDVLAYDPATGRAPLRDRKLGVELWYPAKPQPGAAAVTYAGSFPSEPPAPPAHFTQPGIAVRDAPAAGRNFPLIVVSHGYSNDVAALTWITENLASKGYVVAAIRHDDPPISDRSKFPEPVLRRPLDIAFVTATLQQRLRAEGLIDPGKTALIGYSAGGYGVLVAAGATLDPASPLVKLVPGGLLSPYARGGTLEHTFPVHGLRAVVAIAPMGGGALAAFGSDGLRGLRAPLLLIAGDADRRLSYASGARAFFDQAVHARRYLLTLQGAGHSIGLNRAPDEMRRRLWDEEWFEGPVWRTERVNAINAHFITAFLDRFVKQDETRAAYLDVPVPLLAAGTWPDPAPPAPPPRYGAYSPGTAGITLWKGFQRSQAAGLQLLRAQPDEP